MSEETFFDANWRLLLRKHPLIARKLEEIYCDCVSFEQYEDIEQRIAVLEMVLDRTNKKWRYGK